ncbi:unnamed protein product [Closterium sp. Yama58-4]|nr:unnamed protein product [Closterium sp. Yama58-4]
MAIKTINKEHMKCKEDVEDVRTEVIILGLLRDHPCIINLHDAFEDDKRVLGLLRDHPCIVNLHDAFEDDKYVHLIMELCEGGDLFDRIKQRGQFPERDAALLCRSLAEALLQCGRKGVLHRDVKPENILLRSKECHTRIKLIDFGVAALHTPGTLRMDRAGTVEYTAPEVLDRAYGPEADIWSAGVVLYILLCGFPPFWAATNADLERKIRTAHVDFRHPRWAAISDGAKDLILRMLEKDPTKRITALEIFAHPWIRAAESS